MAHTYLDFLAHTYLEFLAQFQPMSTFIDVFLRPVIKVLVVGSVYFLRPLSFASRAKNACINFSAGSPLCSYIVVEVSSNIIFISHSIRKKFAAIVRW